MRMGLEEPARAQLAVTGTGERAPSSKEGGGREMALTVLSWTHLLDAAPGAPFNI